jgi:hypothetical protein
MIRISAVSLATALLLVSCAPEGEPPPEPPPSSGSAQAPPPEPSASQEEPDPTPTGEIPLTAEGWGPLRVGMTLEEVVAAAGEDANPEAVGGPDPSQCDEFRPSEAPEGMLVMLESNRLSRISVFGDSEVQTDEGFGVGDEAAEIKAAYGPRAEAMPHKYVTAPAEYITVWTSPPASAEPRGIVYEVGEDGLVTHVHAGGPSIQYVEGCL